MKYGDILQVKFGRVPDPKTQSKHYEKYMQSKDN